MLEKERGHFWLAVIAADYKNDRFSSFFKFIYGGQFLLASLCQQCSFGHPIKKPFTP